MQLPHDIQQWLNGPRDYEEGIALATRYQVSPVLLTLLRAGHSQFNADQLEDALRHCVLPTRPITPQIKAVYDRKGELFREATALHQRLTYLATDEQRLNAARTICAHWREIDQCWADIEVFNRTGSLPLPPTPPRQRTPVEGEEALIRERNSLRVQCSKHRHKPEKQDKVTAWKQRIADIHSLLHHDEQ